MERLTFRSRDMGKLWVSVILMLAGVVHAQGNSNYYIHKQNGLEVEVSPVPVWVTDFELGTKKAADSSAGNIKYHLYDRQSNASSKPHHFYRLIKEANNTSGLESVSKLKVNFNPSFQQLMVHSADVYRDGKLIYTLNNNDIKIFSDESDLENEMLTGRAQALILLPSTQVGDVVDFKYSILGANPIFGDRNAYTFSLGWSVPLDLAHIRVVYPASKDINFRTMGVDLKPQETIENELKVLSWTLENPKPIFDEEQYPYGYVRYPFVAVSEYSSWSEVVEQQEPLYRNRNLPKDLMSRIDGITQGLSDAEKVIAVLNFVQEEIRYLGLEYGVNAYKPHLPKEVWRDRRGDCKDKTLLLLSILDTLSIESYPALVHTDYREGLRNALPAPNNFDHVIANVIVDGESYWLDPTRAPQSGKLNEIAYYSYDQALVLKKGQSALTHMPLDSADNDQTFIVEEITIGDYTAPIRLKVSSLYKGKSAEKMKSRFENDHLSKIEQQYIQFYQKQYGQVLDHQTMLYDYDAEKNQFTVEESYLIDSFFKFEGKNVSFNVNASLVNDQLNIPSSQNRQSPFYLGRAKYVHHQIKIHFPQESVNSDLDISTVVKNENFLFRFDQLMMPSTYLLNYEFTINDWIVDLTNVKDVITDMNNVDNLIYRSFNYQPEAGFVDVVVGDLLRNQKLRSTEVVIGRLR